MDVNFFLAERTAFIRTFYDGAVAPFQEIMRQIEAHEAPYEPTYADMESMEPPYLAEWMEAETAVQVLGQSCISLLSASLKLFLETWERQLGFRCAQSSRKAFASGFLNGYRTCFEAALGFGWNDAPADLDILEQVVLARNGSQHPQSITQLNVYHSASLKKPGRHLFFIRDTERDALDEAAGDFPSLLSPSLHIQRETLFRAIDETERFAAWLDARIWSAIHAAQAERSRS